MRPLLAALAILLAGCAETAPAPGTGQDPTGALLAYRAGPSDEPGNSTLLLVRDDGRAERVTFVDDHAATVRLAPGVDHPTEDLDRVFSARGGNLNRSAGGLVLRVEIGRVPDAEWRALSDALRAPWPDAPQADDWIGGEDYVRFRDGAAQLARTPPVPASFEPVVAAFEAADRALVVERVEEAERLPFEQPPGGCLRAEVSTRGALPPGEVLDVAVRVLNCGTEAVELAQSLCRDPPLVAVQVHSMRQVGATLPGTEEPSAAYALDFECRGSDERVPLAPGATASLTRRWNGTLASCDARGCAYEPAPPGSYHVVAFATGQREAQPAGVTVLPPGEPRTLLLVAKEWDWINGTGTQPLRSEFGPHCAPVRYGLDPPHVTSFHYGEDAPPVPEALVVRDWRDGPRPERAVTFSSDRLDALLLPNGTATLRSPFEDAPPLAEVRLEGDAFVVNGTRLREGESTTLRASREIQVADGSYVVESVVVLTHAGRAHHLAERVGGCA